MKLQKITIGADPEMFLYNTKKQNFCSAIEIIPGTKENPYRPTQLQSGFGLQTDNVLVEFNIPPSRFEDEHEFINNILTMRQYIDAFIREKDNNLITVCQASANFPMEELAHPQAMEFGCDPDFNCYNGQQNIKPQIRDITLRSAGFHWHIGFENPNIKYSVKLIRYMDLYMGVPSVLLDRDTKRRKLYGKAGAFRIQPYGVEWRVLSSFFLKSPDLIALMYRQLEKAIQAFEDSEELPNPYEITTTINKSDITKAKELIEKYNITNLI